jgi:two-component system, cell cycle response regulator DivK
MTSKKILIIEDNPLNMQLVSDLLEFASYTICQAGSAEVGIKTAKAESPDLILMDIALPKMDGLTATRILKQDPDTKDIPVIALTAHAMKGDAEKAMSVGCKGYIVKPIQTRQFLKTIADFISGS